MMEQTHPHNAIKYDDVRDGPVMLSVGEQQAFEKQREDLRKLLDDGEIKAKYKLEVIFSRARSTRAPTPGILSFWDSGTKFHGGGDDKVYLCPGEGCQGILRDQYNHKEGVVCPTCGSVWQHQALIGELCFNLPMRKWAEVLHRYYARFDYHCDVYLKYARDDIRQVALAQADRQTWQGSKNLEKARKRVRSIYPLKNIIKDTSAGADLLSRLYAFLVA